MNKTDSEIIFKARSAGNEPAWDKHDWLQSLPDFPQGFAVIELETERPITVRVFTREQDVLSL